MARRLNSYWLILIAFASTWWKCANQLISAFQASCWLCDRVARHITHLFYSTAWYAHSVLPPGLKVLNLFFEEQSVFIRRHAFVDQAILQRVTLKKKKLGIDLVESKARGRNSEGRGRAWLLNWQKYCYFEWGMVTQMVYVGKWNQQGRRERNLDFILIAVGRLSMVFCWWVRSSDLHLEKSVWLPLGWTHSVKLGIRMTTS